jgi:multidrug efflux pump subunit AcrA (membrane-fusion protein)
VEEVTPVAQEVGRRSQRRGFQVTVSIEEADAERMRPGMSVKVDVEVRSLEGALLVPRSALDLASEPPRALLRGGGEAEVRLGPCGALECVVEEGLEEGARLRSRT